MFGASQPRTTTAAMVEANAVFTRMRQRQVALPQLVAAVQQLASISREAGRGEVQEICSGQHFRQLLAELSSRLPRDAYEHVPFESAWTSQVLGALRELRPHGLDSRLGTRLGHVVSQAAPDMELEGLLHTVCELCAIFDSQHQGIPDDYLLWILGNSLNDICSRAGQADGAVGAARIVNLLHLFAHPAIRHRCSARWSLGVLDRIQAIMPQCTAGEMVKLLEAYSDVPTARHILLDALSGLTAAGADATAAPILGASLRELTVAAAVLGSYTGDEDVLASSARTILGRLAQLLRDDADGCNFELVVACASSLDGKLAKDDEDVHSAMADVLGIVGPRACDALSKEEGAGKPMPSDSLVRLLTLSLRWCSGPNSPALATGGAEGDAPWPLQISSTLSEHVDEMDVERLADLASAMEFTSLALDPRLVAAMQVVVKSRAAAMPLGHFCTFARTFAAASVLQNSLFHAFDVEAHMARPVEPGAAAALAWSMAVSGWDSVVSWSLLVGHVQAIAPQRWSELPTATRAHLYEALGARRALAAGSAWQVGNTAADILADESWKECWQQHQAQTVPTTLFANSVASALEAIGKNLDRQTVGGDELYARPLFLKDDDIIIDLMATLPRHPVSRQVRGEVSLRHDVWTEQGPLVLALTEATWAQLAASEADKDAAEKRRQDWCRGRLDILTKTSLMRKAELPTDEAALFEELPLGAGGITLRGLQRLAELPKASRLRAVSSFKSAWSRRKDEIANPEAYLMGIIASEKGDDVGAGATDLATAKARPKEGWDHKGARDIRDFTVGEEVSGRVTNVLRGRVWVDVGCTKDASFYVAGRVFKVGQLLQGMTVSKVSTADPRPRLEVEPPPSGGEVRRRGERPARAKSPQTPQDDATTPATGARPKAAAKRRGGGGKVPGEREEESIVDGRPMEAARFRPKEGWHHDGGKLVASLRAGQEVVGRVTNIYQKRVWVDIGAERDASFWTTFVANFAIGDEVHGVVDQIDFDKKRVQLHVPGGGNKGQQSPDDAPEARSAE